VVEGADCGILLDINNIFVSAFNHGFSAAEYLRNIPITRVHQFHLAGHTDRGSFLHDTHDHPVADAVWALYAQAVERFGRVSTLIEWDDRIPAFAVLQAEAGRAKQIVEAKDDVSADPGADAAVAVAAPHRA
jgi:hypothetical protein